MFEYAFSQKATLQKVIESGDRYGTTYLSDEVISINVLKYDSLVRVDTGTGFEFVNKSVFLTDSPLPNVKDAIDGIIIESVKSVNDIYGDFVYKEIEFV